MVTTMNPGRRPDPAYVMGRSDHETKGLARRAQFLIAPTARLFQDAGITTALSVLDIAAERATSVSSRPTSSVQAARSSEST
jgi:hypothetical protein